VLPLQVFVRVVNEETSETGEHDIDLFSVVFAERNKKKNMSLLFRLWDTRAAERAQFEDLKNLFKQPYIKLDLSKQWLVFDGFFQIDYYSGLHMRKPIFTVCRLSTAYIECSQCHAHEKAYINGMY
jgi:hypothetical protein